jgi:predicted HicB family RNase H-like nuclease
MTTATAHYEEIKTAAEKLYEERVDWTVFYGRILGLRGVIRRHFPNVKAMAKFEQSDTYREIQRMLADLRKRSPAKAKKIATEQNGEIDSNEETRVITVRIPQSLHDALRIEAYEHHTSMNKLCISKLLQYIENDHVPGTLGEEKAEADL